MSYGMQNQDDEVIRLLGKLNEAAPEYPPSLLNKRRAAVMAAFAALNLGAAAVGLGLLGGLAKILKGMGLIEKIILGVEVAAVTGMTAYGAATAYIHRNEIRQIIEGNLGISTNTPFPSLSVPVGGGAGGETGAPFVGTGTPSMTPTPTPTMTGTLYPTEPNIAGETNVPPTNEPPGATPTQPPAMTSTPQPANPTPTNCGKNGICLGKSSRTPKPTQSGGGGNSTKTP